RPVAQIAELAQRGRQRFDWFMHDLDGMLTAHDHVAGNEFSVADITALVALDFGLRGLKMEMPARARALTAWHARVSNRPAIKGGRALWVQSVRRPVMAVGQRPWPENGLTDADHRGAFGDGYLEVAGHAHR